jgi:hypothetical protein
MSSFLTFLRSKSFRVCKEILPKNRVLKKLNLERKKGAFAPFFHTPIDFTMQRRLFYNPTEAVLPCKTASVAV